MGRGYGGSQLWWFNELITLKMGDKKYLKNMTFKILILDYLAIDYKKSLVFFYVSIRGFHLIPDFLRGRAVWKYEIPLTFAGCLGPTRKFLNIIFKKYFRLSDNWLPEILVFLCFKGRDISPPLLKPLSYNIFF